jgi:hypothetical protein
MSHNSDLTLEEQYIALYQKMARLSEKAGWGDPFSYARSKEILATCVLGHTVATTFSGADAYNQKNEPVEYKSTTQAKVQGSYTGISVQSTWEEQERYLREDKIGKYPEHYYNRFEDGKLVESWRVPGHKVLELLLPKLKSKYATTHTRKDPRLGAVITNKEILQYGEKVI